MLQSLGIRKVLPDSRAKFSKKIPPIWTITPSSGVSRDWNFVSRTKSMPFTYPAQKSIPHHSGVWDFAPFSPFDLKRVSQKNGNWVVQILQNFYDRCSYLSWTDWTRFNELSNCFEVSGSKLLKISGFSGFTAVFLRTFFLLAPKKIITYVPLLGEHNPMLRIAKKMFTDR